MDYCIYSGFDYFSQKLTNKIGDIYSQQSYILMYSFDPDGYIAYYSVCGVNINEQAEKLSTEDYTEKNVGSMTAAITDENAVLFNCKDETSLFFSDMNALYTYCHNNGIELGDTYYSLAGGSLPSKEVVNAGNWSIQKTPKNHCIVKNKMLDMFMGSIDRFAVIDNFLLFHITITDEDYIPENVNNALNIDMNLPMSEKKSGLFDKCNVFADEYIAVNTNTDTFKIYSSENDVKSHISEIDGKIKWEKVKY